MPRRLPSVLVVLLLAAATLAAADAFLQRRYELLGATREAHEIKTPYAAVDFDLDGEPDEISVEAYAGQPALSYLVVRSVDRELLLLPYSYSEATARTHIAINSSEGSNQLLVFDAVANPPPYGMAYEYDGSELAPSEPSPQARLILDALAAGDRLGTLQHWEVYHAIRPFTIPSFLALSAATLLLASRRGRSTQRPRREPPPISRPYAFLCYHALIVSLLGYALLAACLLVKPTNYPIFSPAVPPTLSAVVLLRAAQVLWWLSGPVEALALLGGLSSLAPPFAQVRWIRSVTAIAFSGLLLYGWVWFVHCAVTDCM